MAKSKQDPNKFYVALAKYKELWMLHSFATAITIDGVEVRFAFGDNAFRYWHGSTIVKFDFSKPEDVERFLDTKIAVVIGTVDL